MRRRSSDDETDWTQWVVIYFGTMISRQIVGVEFCCQKFYGAGCSRRIRNLQVG